MHDKSDNLDEPPASIRTELNNSGFYVIHAGIELGPFSLGELAEQAVAGKIDADDLVKQTGGLWMKARELPALQEQFHLKQVKQETLDKLGQFHGIWVSQKSLKVGCAIAVGLLFVVVVWNLSNRPNAEECRERAYLSLFNHDYEKAIKEFDEAIRLNPNDASAFSGRGEAWLSKEEFDKAIHDLDEAIRLNPHEAKRYHVRGFAWSHKKEYGKAINDFDKAISLHSPAFYQRGRAWLLTEEYERAIKDFDEAIRLNARDYMAYDDRGFAWQQLKEYDKAISDYDEAIRINPTNDWTYNSRGNARFAKNESANAIKDFDEAIRLNPRHEFAYGNRGRVWSAKGEYEKAMKDFRTDRKIRGLPEVTLFMRSDDFGYVRGTVHNETGKAIQKINLSIKTARWERDYEIPVSVPSNATAPFSVLVGDALLDVIYFNVLNK